MSADTTVNFDTLIDASRLLDDNLMTLVFDGNIEAAQLVLNIILDRKDLKVKSVAAQKIGKNPLVKGRDVIFDILSEDSEGNYHNIEVQRENKGASPKRARFLSAVLDHHMLKGGQDFQEMKSSYAIFITEKDTFKKGRPLSHIDRTVLEDGSLFGDGNHIIYANGNYRNNDNPIGRLMHDFRCRNAEDMYYEPLKESVRYFKETEGGRVRMSSEIEKYGDAREAEGEARGEARGETKGEARGKARFGELTTVLLKAGKTDELARAAQDKEYLEKLLDEMGI